MVASQLALGFASQCPISIQRPGTLCGEFGCKTDNLSLQKFKQNKSFPAVFLDIKISLASRNRIMAF